MKNTGRFHLPKNFGNFAGNFRRLKNMFHLTQVPFVPRLHSRAILRAKVKDMAANSLELVKLINGTRISNGKTGLPFQTFRCSRKFSTGTTRKVVFHLLSNRNFRNRLVNGKRELPTGLVYNKKYSEESLKSAPSLLTVSL